MPAGMDGRDYNHRDSCTPRPLSDETLALADLIRFTTLRFDRLGNIQMGISQVQRVQTGTGLTDPSKYLMPHHYGFWSQTNTQSKKQWTNRIEKLDKYSREVFEAVIVRWRWPIDPLKKTLDSLVNRVLMFFGVHELGYKTPPRRSERGKRIN